MARIFLVVMMGLAAVLPARAADEAAGESKGGNKVERAVDKAGAAVGGVADTAVGGVKKGVDSASKAMDNAGNKTSRWLKEKTGLKENTD